MSRSLVLTSLALAACAKSTAPAPAPQPQPVEATPSVEAAAPSFATLDAVLASAHRGDDAARDVFRRPAQTLRFCGLQPDLKVLELAPGSGWYTRILAPYLRDDGVYAGGPPSAEGRRAKYRQRYVDLIDSDASLYGKAKTLTFDPPDDILLGPSNMLDLILTFRNTHSWIGDSGEAQAFAAAFDALKPGGVFCVVQHRAPESAEGTPKELAKTGYVKQSYVISLAESAGFALDEASELHANPADTADHPKGVWTLPPSLALGDEDRDKYVAIGESDRMTLRFVKPAAEPATGSDADE